MTNKASQSKIANDTDTSIHVHHYVTERITQFANYLKQTCFFILVSFYPHLYNPLGHGPYLVHFIPQSQAIL